VASAIAQRKPGVEALDRPAHEPPPAAAFAPSLERVIAWQRSDGNARVVRRLQGASVRPLARAGARCACGGVIGADGLCDRCRQRQEAGKDAESETALARSAAERRLDRQSGEAAPADAPGCPPYEPGEKATSLSADGHLAADVEQQSGRLLVSDFGVGRSDVKQAARDDQVLQHWLAAFEANDSYELAIVGYSDCNGAGQTNNVVRHGRAAAVEQLLGPGARSRVTFRGQAGLGQYLVDNATVAGRARNRGVEIRFQQRFDMPEEPIVATECDTPKAPTSLDEYAQLVGCAERKTGHGPREMLSLLRQLYYSDQSWTVCRGRGCAAWANVITCGLPIADPRPALGPKLYGALAGSQVVDGVDIGHVFAGLESMMCPSASVNLDLPLGLNWLVSMPNQEFASWGGDLGSAVGLKVHRELDEGRPPAPWSDYFGTAPTPPGARGVLASLEDMEGNIDAYVLRHGLSGMASPAASAGTAPSLTGPLSLTLGDYYAGAGTPLGDAHENRFRLFTEAIGGRISGGRIINRATLQTAFAGRISSFADMYYSLTWHTPWPPRPAGAGVHLYLASDDIARLFLDWLESKL
jgi:outer membrane protein OmpA-like peptidoglycan-associated protein